jgi:NADH-quinone oxidoreductase subunit L
MTWSVALLPLLGGLGLWAGRAVVPAWHGEGASRRTLGMISGALCLGSLVLAAIAAAGADAGRYDVGAGLVMHAELVPLATVVALLVPAVAAVVIAYAAAHEPRRGLHRLVSLLVAFVGAMQLIVVAGDVLTLLVGWELVAALSWALIGHRWEEDGPPAAAAHAFNVSRFGGLGLFLAAGAGLARTGSLAFADWTALDGSHLHVVVAGILLAAATKSGQVPFSPWLFSAMAGPTPVSALLHSSTMVAAGAFVLARLHPVLDQAPWFAPTTIVLGLVTALAGGVVALLQQHAKRLLAASTSAQYGLMLVAVGAGYPLVAVIHLVVHALFKAQLFLAAGIGMSATGSPDLPRWRLGRALPTTALLALVGAASLAAVPPLSGGASKEQVLAAGTHHAVGVGLLVLAAGVLSALYAARFHLLAFGRSVDPDAAGPRQLAHPPGQVERGALGVLAAGLLLLSLLWLPPVEHALTGWLGGELPPAEPWELPASVATVALVLAGVWLADRHGHLGSFATGRGTRAAADWLGLPSLSRLVVVGPARALAAAAARFDDRVLDRVVTAVGRAGSGVATRVAPFDRRVLDAGVRGAGRLGGALATVSDRFAERGIDGAVEILARTVDRAAREVRRLQTGLVHHQYVVIVVGLVVAIAAAALGR